MIQPISLNQPRLNTAFKNSAAAVKTPAPEANGGDSANMLMTYLQEKDKKDQKMQLISLAASGAILAGALIYMPKFIKKSTKDTVKDVSSFVSLKNDNSIPTLDTCKSINKKLKTFLENQVMYANATKEDIVKTGSPEAANRLIMYGPPGSGKSFFSKIFAKTIGADYMEVNYSKISRRFVGEEQENFKTIFNEILQTAEKHPEKKFVVNFNEIDSIIANIDNATDMGGGHISSKKEIRAMFLTAIEELALKTPNVIFIGSTNTSARGNLDGAALSRFKNVIKVDYPEISSILEALKDSIKQLPEGEDFVKNNTARLEKLAENMYNRTASFRDLNNVVNESKNIYLRNVLKDKNSSYKIDYVEQAFKLLDLTDGEINNIKQKQLPIVERSGE